MGYRKVSAAEQIYYIIKYAVRRAAKRLRSRLRHWLKRGKGCRRCCLWCKYFEQCRSEIETAKQNGLTAKLVYVDEKHTPTAYCIHCARCGKLLQITNNPPPQSLSAPIKNIRYFCQECHTAEHRKEL